MNISKLFRKHENEYDFKTLDSRKLEKYSENIEINMILKL